MKKSMIVLILVLTQIHLSYGQCINCDSSSTVIGSSVIGGYNTLNGAGSIVIGQSSITGENASNSIAIGAHLASYAGKTITIGCGINSNYRLVNIMHESLLVGFNSNLPTFFVSRSEGYDRTGKISIGNVTDEQGQIIPKAKLHIRADNGEPAVILLEPNDWESGESASLQLGNMNHNIVSDKISGIKFNSDNNFLFNGINTGFGIEEPKAKVHINGDLLFEHDLNGIIMKSEDGNCWKGLISNTGELIFSIVDCETLSSSENLSEQKHSEVFVYPNPSDGQITIEYHGKEKQIIAELTTINGLLISSYKIKRGKTNLDIANVYEQILILSTYTTTGDIISTNKIIVRK